MPCEIRFVPAADHTVSRWSGGTTTQLAIFPEGADYARRDFLWRLSSATVELEESDFTPLPDYDRVISVLSGRMTLTHEDGEPLPLEPYGFHRFDGGVRTHSRGRVTDFNLMLRKGRCAGSLGGLLLEPGAALTLMLPPPEGGREHRAFYCAEGALTAGLDSPGRPLAAGDLLLAVRAGPRAERLVLRAGESGARLVTAQIRG